MGEARQRAQRDRKGARELLVERCQTTLIIKMLKLLSAFRTMEIYTLENDTN